MLLTVLVVFFAASVTLHVLRTATAADALPAIMRIDEQRLAGRWIRPDGGYILEVKEIKKDGGLIAAYFNPNPINVSRAEWQRTQGALAVFIELRDTNYPGSIYKLHYDQKTDRMMGTYFQAVQKETYEVEFIRAK
jgi:hypothetical protein